MILSGYLESQLLYKKPKQHEKINISFSSRRIIYELRKR